MKQVSYEDEKGRHWATLLPDDIPEEDAFLGIPLGPPPLEVLGLPEEIEVRLHNELFSRGLFTPADVKRRINDVVASLQAALRVDAGLIIGLYLNGSKEE